MTITTLKPEERVSLALRGLYQAYGYQPYKVSKFEEYDLYAQNKNFLSSKQILTFSDTNGRLMALKPDITLSIIKNTQDNGRTQKVWYTENVYRVPRNAYGFQEIMQTGLECIGTVDRYAMCEVLMLAARSLETISPEYVLDLSHMGILTGVLSGVEEAVSAEILAAIEEKNSHALASACRRSGMESGKSELLRSLALLSGPAQTTLPALLALPLPRASREAAQELSELCALLEGFGSYHINLDLSVINDMDYYTGLIFRGFIDGIASGVLSGGQYDNLLNRMGKSGSAIGFAVYLDALERFFVRSDAPDVDVLLQYDADCDPAQAVSAAKALTDAGETVHIQPAGDASVTYGRCIHLTKKEGGIHD